MKDPKMFGLKGGELRPCDFCGATLGGNFRLVDLRLAVVDVRALRQMSGLSTMLGSYGLAEVMGADPHVVKVLDEEASVDRLFCCTDCYVHKFGEACEKVAALKEKAEEPA